MSSELPGTCRVVIVRHAQTTENQHLIVIVNAIVDLLKHFILPDADVFKSIFHLLKFDVDSELSPLGTQQAQALFVLMNDSTTLKALQPDAIIVSKLKRTRQTAQLLFPDAPADVFIETELLNEASPLEYVAPASLHNRIRRFHDWLEITIVAKKNVVIVGHCQYLKQMLQTNQRMKNCDIYEASYEPSGTANLPPGRSRWSGVRHVLCSPLTSPHPIDKLKLEILEPAYRFVAGVPQMVAAAMTRGAYQSEDQSQQRSSTDEVMCRICQATADEAPNMKMISPCRCSGSLKHVHESCLARWRATSDVAFERCQICGFHYIRTQSKLASMIANPSGVLLITGFILLLAISISGSVGLMLLDFWDLDVVEKLCTAIDMPMYWRQCAWYHGVTNVGAHSFSFCEPNVASGVEVAIVGTLVVGVVGLISGCNVQQAVFSLAPVAWLFSMNENARIRVVIALGSILAARFVYVKVTQLARQLLLAGEAVENLGGGLSNGDSMIQHTYND